VRETTSVNGVPTNSQQAAQMVLNASSTPQE
jgi:hypothetical protein